MGPATSPTSDPPRRPAPEAREEGKNNGAPVSGRKSPRGGKIDKRDHRQWIDDRVKGNSKLGNDRPPLRCCLVPPCVGCCPGVLEQNCVCETIGRIGIVRPDDKYGRRWLMRIGLITQVIGLILTAIACFAISTEYNLLSSLSYTKGVVTAPNLAEDVELAIGLRAVAFNNPNPGAVGKTVITFEEFCSLTPAQTRNGTGPEFDAQVLSTYLNPRDCGECAAVSGSMVSSLVMSLVSYLPTIFTDVLRMYPNYDVNCQKAFGMIVAIFGLLMAINTWLTYMGSCVNNFYDGFVPYSANGEILLRENAANALNYLDFNWTEGTGLICLIIATFLKIVDIVCHFLLPTPSITRNHAEQVEYEKLSQQDSDNDEALQVEQGQIFEA